MPVSWISLLLDKKPEKSSRTLFQTFNVSKFLKAALQVSQWEMQMQHHEANIHKLWTLGGLSSLWLSFTSSKGLWWMTVVLILNQSIHMVRLAVGLDDRCRSLPTELFCSVLFYSILFYSTLLFCSVLCCSVLKIDELSLHALGYSSCFGFLHLCFLVCSSAENLTLNFTARARHWPSGWRIWNLDYASCWVFH